MEQITQEVGNIDETYDNMNNRFVFCQDCLELWTLSEIRDKKLIEHKERTGHSQWTLCYGVLLMLTLWRWVIMSKTEYRSLTLENEALKRKALKQADIIAETKNKMMRKAKK